MNKRNIPLTALALLVAGCAPTTQEVRVAPEKLEQELAYQKQAVVNNYYGEIRRLHRLSYDLLIHGAPFCGEDVAQRFGFTSYASLSFPEVMRGAAETLLDLGDGKLRIAYVMPDSPADKAGLESDDLLVELNGVSYYYGIKSILGLRFSVPQANQDGSVNELVYERDGVEYTVELGSIEGCSYGVGLLFDDTVNAFADGENIYFNSGFMRTFDDEQVRFVAAHEIAHNAMKHIDAKLTNTRIGLLVDIVAIAAAGVDPLARNVGAYAYSQEFEAEADYVGQYLLARAGYDPGKAAELWREMALVSPHGVFQKESYFNSHPDHASRHLSMAKHAEEIKEKIANGEELVPNLKE